MRRRGKIGRTSPRRWRWAAAVGIGLSLVGPAAVAQGAGSIEAGLQEAVAARRGGDAERAFTILVGLAAREPDNADVQVQLGFSALALDRREAAETAFRKALAVAPDYVDANLGLAQIAFRRGDYETAETEAGIVLAARDDPEAKALMARLDAARAAAAVAVRAVPRTRGPTAAPAVSESAPHRWRVDFDATFSNLSSGYDDWAEGRLAIARRLDDATTLSAAGEFYRRFDQTDLYLEGRIDWRHTDRLSVYVYLGGTPDADFRPELAYGGGLAARLHDGDGPWGPGLATLDIADAEYTSDRVLTLSPGWQQYFWDGRAWLTVRWINSLVELREHHAGYAIRGDLQLTDRLRVNAGYSDAPDTTDGVTVDVRSVFGGVWFVISDEITMRATASYETRSQGYDRAVLSIGVGSAF